MPGSTRRTRSCPPLGQVVALSGVDRWVYTLLGTPTQLSDFAVPGFFVIAGLLGAGAQGASLRVRAAELLVRLGLFFSALRTPGRWVRRLEAPGRVAFALWLLFLGADTVRAHPLLMAAAYAFGAAVPLVVVTLFLARRLPRPVFRRVFGH
jgi:hypothetical protein